MQRVRSRKWLQPYWKFYVYLHRKADTGEPFYVGKGSRHYQNKKNQPTYCRAYSRHGVNTRPKHWKNVVKKHGLVVELVASCKTDAEAQRLEQELIARIGRKDLRNGPLVNLTDGGDGHAGIIVPQSERNRRRQWLLDHPISPEQRARMIATRRKNGGNGGVVKKGDRLPARWVESISKGKMGFRNPWFGRPSPISKKVIDTSTGMIYDTIVGAAKAAGVSRAIMYNHISGFRPKLNLVHLEGYE